MFSVQCLMLGVFRCPFATFVSFGSSRSLPFVKMSSNLPPMFRPCIDLHDGKVKQIVGGTLGAPGELRTNFVSDRSAAWFAEQYRRDGLKGGHVVMLGPGNDVEARAA